jgi:uncharacterized repeat protein (TIGR03803 family)
MRARFFTVSLLLSTFLLPAFTHAADRETDLYNFNPHSASNPYGGLLLDSEGNLYGATLSGTIFEFKPNGSGGWTYNVLCDCGATYSFGSLVMDQAGNLYTSTYFGDVYEYSPSSSGTWTISLVYTFGVSGEGPSPLILDSAGNLYGAFAYGGANGLGYVFELTPATSGTWILTDLHDFDGADGAESTSGNAANLVGALTMDASGHLFGTTGAGGSSTECPGGCGVVFELTNNAGTWTETVLHSFTGTDGMNPDAPLLIDPFGHLFGTATSGGASGFGVVFETALVGGSWQTQDIYSFTNANGDGAYPNSALIMDASGDIFGTTDSGGGSTSCTVVDDNGCGTAFELKRKGSTWKEGILHDFHGTGDGGFPAGVVLENGNLYGLAEVGGRYNVGLFYELTPQ